MADLYRTDVGYLDVFPNVKRFLTDMAERSGYPEGHRAYTAERTTGFLSNRLWRSHQQDWPVCSFTAGLAVATPNTGRGRPHPR